ncbi:MAG: helix-turn-helix transcriptional regulator [Dehalococcoidia bacterium]|nr:helix-turn-helix transcriptional regulator [Dehalococcoidia bacterium]
MDHPRFTPSERRIIPLLAQALPSGQIAQRLGVPVDTVRSHRGNIQRKFDVSGPAELTRAAILHVEVQGCCSPPAEDASDQND